MHAQLVLCLSILLQLVAACLAVRLVWVAGKSAAWLSIAAAITLINVRRVLALYNATFNAEALNLLEELIVLGISVLFLVGISRISPLFSALRDSQEALSLNESRLEALWRLSHMTNASLKEITDFALEEGVRLTKSQIGYLAFLTEDESVLVMHSWSKSAMQECTIPEKSMIYPVETTGLWGEAVRQRQAIITNDYAAPDPCKKGYPAGHVAVRRHMNVPVFDEKRIVAVAGVGNKEAPYDQSDVRQLVLLMTGMWWLIKRQQAEQAMTQEVERGLHLQSRLIDTCMDGIIASDQAGEIFIFNDNAAKIMGYQPEEVIGKLNARDLYRPGVAHEIKVKIYDPALGGLGILENFETAVIHKDGSVIPVWLSARVLYEDDHEVGIIGHFRDLRERKRLEEELLRSERLAVLGKMVAHVTHEIKNPLMVIGAFAKKLEGKTEFSEDAHHKLQIIREEAQRLEQFLMDLGKFSRAAPTQKAPGDLLALLRETGEMMEAAFREAGVEFQIQAESIPILPFDSGQIRQILINLFKNALEAMPQGGRLTVAAESKDDQLVLKVTDTGAGIRPEDLPQLFTPFFTTKPGGTGLGLSICRQLIEQHQGEIQLLSQVGCGTTCLIRLPLN
jgi:PAS domain S-box-containing protein